MRSPALSFARRFWSWMYKPHFRTFLLNVNASWGGPGFSCSQKKQTSFSPVWCCVLWWVNFFAAVNPAISVTCRFSARSSLVLLNFPLQDWCHLAWFSSIVASIALPPPSSRRLRSIGMGISCSSLKQLIFLAMLEYPWPRTTSRLLDCASHWSGPGVASWQRKQIDPSVLAVSFDGPVWFGSTSWKVLDIVRSFPEPIKLQPQVLLLGLCETYKYKLSFFVHLHWTQIVNDNLEPPDIDTTILILS